MSLPAIESFATMGGLVSMCLEEKSLFVFMALVMATPHSFTVFVTSAAFLSLPSWRATGTASSLMELPTIVVYDVASLYARRKVPGLPGFVCTD